MARTKNKYSVKTSFVALDGNYYVSYTIGQVVELSSKQAKQWSTLLTPYKEASEEACEEADEDGSN